MEPDLTGIRVLLVDDNEATLLVFGAFLAHVGAMVTTARNGPRHSTPSPRAERT